MNYVKDLEENISLFFNFMKEKYPVYYNSNIFFRDMQYAIKYFYKNKGIEITYPQSEKICNELVDLLTKNGLLTKIDHKSFKVNFKPEGSVLEEK